MILASAGDLNITLIIYYVIISNEHNHMRIITTANISKQLKSLCVIE